MASIRQILWAIASLASLAASTQDAQAPLTDNSSSDTFVCEHPPYKVHMVSKSPLVIYISNFLTDRERAHLQNVTHNTFSHSGVASSAGGKEYHQVRTSTSASVPRDAVVRCIEDRALAFQGFDVARERLEPLQLVRYGAGGRYHFHTDWFTDAANAKASMGGNRVSSFFAYVRVASEGEGEVGEGGARRRGVLGGGTNFPLVDAPSDRRWCEEGFVDCDEEWERGVTFRPVEGNAIYWENLLVDGRGDPRTLHAGLPLLRGDKIGMNIWTREGPLSEAVRGPDV